MNILQTALFQKSNVYLTSIVIGVVIKFHVVEVPAKVTLYVQQATNLIESNYFGLSTFTPIKLPRSNVGDERQCTVVARLKYGYRVHLFVRGENGRTTVVTARTSVHGRPRPAVPNLNAVQQTLLAKRTIAFIWLKELLYVITVPLHNKHEIITVRDI